MELFLVEIRAADWPRAVAWYRDVLGLPLALEDAAHQYVLLDAGAGRVAIKGGGQTTDRVDVRLVFHVDDLDATRRRLLSHGVAVGEPIDNPAEGYREARLADPEGTPIHLFAWTNSHRAP